jgi:putative SOS response-associated peptidase YedK
VVLDSEGVETWLDPEPDGARLAAIPERARLAPMEARKVSRRVNSPANEGADLIQPADD